METRDVHILSSMRRVYHHFGRSAVTIWIAGEWVRTLDRDGLVTRHIPRAGE
ncbi:hypothetical protein Godav_022868 [Gossypium davidsonii]|uniref:Uncharacterized protein n=1 Tax=Gossypium davidsonii TaxID=34287 RepID=A0A7J8SPP7_GOSDV|nr:hypothetical protein [Gossypium davidsonii]